MRAPDEHSAVLHTGEMPTPQLFQSGLKIGFVRNGMVIFGGQKFTPEGDGLPEGTEVVLRLVNAPGAPRIAFESRAERDAYDAWVESEREKRNYERQVELARREEEERQRRDKVVADLRERVPFNWTTGVKVVYSGVRSNSDGTGTNRRSVTHIAPLDDIECGRLKRKAEQFLCDIDNGKMWGSLDRERGPNCPTCPKCLEIIERLIPNPKLVVHRREEDEPSGPRP